MKKSAILWIVIAVIVIAGGAYAFTRRAAKPTQTSSSQQTGNKPTGSNFGGADLTVLKSTKNTKLGTILVGNNGVTLYMFTKDKPGVSNCTGQCASNWPPYAISQGIKLTAASGINGKVGTITRADGQLQVTYNNQPLYFWHNDKKPGDATGQGFNNVWFVVHP